MNRTKKGFTLAELLVSVSIIAIITTASVSIYSDTMKRARDAQRIADMEAIRVALDAYYLDNGHYPGQENTLPQNQAISGFGQYIGVDDHCLGSRDARPCTTGSWGSIDDELEPYMDHVPQDPLYDPTDAFPEYYYAYDPMHNASLDQYCNEDDTSHPFYQPNCPNNCTTLRPPRKNVGVVFGFNRSETRNTDILKFETCNGGHQNLDNAHYNVVLFPRSP